MEANALIALGAVEKQKSSYSTHFEQNFNCDGSPKSTDLENIFNAPQDNVDDIIGYAKYCYRKHGIIMRVINIIRDFGASGLKLSYPTKAERSRQVVEEYNKRVDMEQLVKDIIFEMALTGNVACYDRDGQRVDIYPINRIKVVPLIKNNKQVIAYKVDSTNISTDDYGDDVNKAIESAYPKEILEAQKNGSMYAILDTENAYFAKINASQYEPYGVSVVLPAFEDLSHKSLLKEAEKSTANDIINKILHIKVGDADNKPNSNVLNEYNRLFTGKSGSLLATTPYYVDIAWVEPSTDIFGEDKFVEIDTDILNTLGVSLTLIRGEGGGNYAEGMLNFTGLVRTIEGIRHHIPCIIDDLYRKEFIRQGLKPEHAPRVEFDDIIIDKATKTDLLLQLFQSAGLPYRVLYEGCDLDYDYVKLVREEENAQEMDDTFKTHGMSALENMQNGDGENPNEPTKQQGGQKKSWSQRKSDKTQSNNDAPRTGLNKTNRSLKKK